METLRHRTQMNHLISAFESALRERDDVFVGGNMFVYFSPHQLKNEHFRGPDVLVVLGAEGQHERLSWVLWEEMRLPDVVIELTSPSTRTEDYGKKKDIYERVWKTAFYAIYDPATHRLDAWELDGGRYRALEKDDRGDVEIAILGLRLGVRALPLSLGIPAPSLRVIDREGKVFPTQTELETRTAELETRTAELEAELARLRAR
jgi:Uma2 family endonuclease